MPWGLGSSLCTQTSDSTPHDLMGGILEEAMKLFMTRNVGRRDKLFV